MERTCELCRKSLESRDVRARFCGSSCRSKAHKTARRMANVIELPRVSLDPGKADGIAHAVLRNYSRDELTSPVGALARKLASDLDQMVAVAPGYASLARELRAVLAQLDKRSASRKANPLLELRRRRAQDRASADGPTCEGD